MDCIPTALALAHRGMSIRSSSCRICFNRPESSEHLVVACPYMHEDLIWIFNWHGIPLPSLSSMKYVISYAANWGYCPMKRKSLLAVVYGWLWCVWRTRNKKYSTRCITFLLKRWIRPSLRSLIEWKLVVALVIAIGLNGVVSHLAYCNLFVVPFFPVFLLVEQCHHTIIYMV